MALKLLTGTNAAIDIGFGGSPVSVKCFFGRWRLAINAQAFGQTTFCSGGWVVEALGLKQGALTLGGYASTGNAYSDPLALFAAAPVAGILTADTANTISGSFNPTTDAIELVAAANSGRDVDMRSTSALTTAWVIM